MADKQVVKFKAFRAWRNHPAGAVQAILEGVENHHKLDSVDSVVTSAVLRIDYVSKEDHTPYEIETLNTIYRKAD